jgi:hypothetical protein
MMGNDEHLLLLFMTDLILNEFKYVTLSEERDLVSIAIIWKNESFCNQ